MMIQIFIHRKLLSRVTTPVSLIHPPPSESLNDRAIKHVDGVC